MYYMFMTMYVYFLDNTRNGSIKFGLNVGYMWRRGGLMVSVLDFGGNTPGLSPGLGHCVVFLGKTLYSHGASLHPGV